MLRACTCPTTRRARPHHDDCPHLADLIGLGEVPDLGQRQRTHTHLGGNVEVAGPSEGCPICEEWRGFRPPRRNEAQRREINRAAMLEEDPTTIAFFQNAIEHLTKAVCDTSLALIKAREVAEAMVLTAEAEQAQAVQDLHDHVHDFMGILP